MYYYGWTVEQVLDYDCSSNDAYDDERQQFIAEVVKWWI